jgi:hypothetical protein
MNCAAGTLEWSAGDCFRPAGTRRGMIVRRQVAMDHAILTRFNLPTAGPESLIRARAGWLAQRVELFDRYCLPSVRSQTSANFGWLVYFDPESPRWLRQRIEDWSAEGAMVPLFRAAVSNAELLSDIEAHIGRHDAWLITTGLDNDDALAADFVERVQRAPRIEGRHAVYIRNGLIRRGGDVYARRDSVNAFCSVREPWVGARTCWSEWHNLIPRTMPTHVLGGNPGWLQVVHGTNVSNRVRGRLTTPAPHRRLFPGALDDAPDPPRGAVVRDALLGTPRRWAVDELRQVGKTAVMRVAGKPGLERVKWALATVRQR